MSEAVPEAVQQYAEKISSPEPALLQKINRETNLTNPQSYMLSGHWQGRMLSMISRMIRPKRILEIGTFTGYSAICLAEGLQEDGHLDTIDLNDELETASRQYLQASAMGDKISLHIGDALDVIPTLEGPFDLVFIDADKPNYVRYYDLVIDKVPSGGYLLADNVLYHGEVFLPAAQQSNNARGISSFNEKVAADPRVEQVLIPLRDGLLLIRKR